MSDPRPLRSARPLAATARILVIERCRASVETAPIVVWSWAEIDRQVRRFMTKIDRFTAWRSAVSLGATSWSFSESTRFGTESAQSTVLFCSARYCSPGSIAVGAAPSASTCWLCHLSAAQNLKASASASRSVWKIATSKLAAPADDEASQQVSAIASVARTIRCNIQSLPLARVRHCKALSGPSIADADHDVGPGAFGSSCHRGGRAGPIDACQHRCGNLVWLFHRDAVASLGDKLQLRVAQALSIGPCVGDWNQIIALASNHHGGAGEPVQSISQLAVMQIGWRKADAGGEPEHAVAQKLALGRHAAVGKHCQRLGRAGIAEQRVPEVGVVTAVLGLHHHENVGNWMLRHKEPSGADQRKRAHALRDPYRDLGRDPAADRGSGEVKFADVQRIEQLQIVEHHVLDVVDLLILFASAAAGMRGRDDADLGSEWAMERQPIAAAAVDIGETMEIDERFAGPGLRHGHSMTANVESTNHCAAPAIAISPRAGKFRANRSAESRRSAGATPVANKRMLLRASLSSMLPK